MDPYEGDGPVILSLKSLEGGGRENGGSLKSGGLGGREFLRG